MSAPDPKAVEGAIAKLARDGGCDCADCRARVTLIAAARAYLRAPTAPQGAEPVTSPQESHKLAEELERLVRNHAAVAPNKSAANQAFALADFALQHADTILVALRSSPSEQDALEIALRERDIAREMYDIAIKHLTAITGLLRPSDVHLPDGRVMRFDKPELELECYRALCKAIVDARKHVDAAIAASGGAKGDGNG